MGAAPCFFVGSGEIVDLFLKQVFSTTSLMALLAISISFWSSSARVYNVTFKFGLVSLIYIGWLIVEFLVFVKLNVVLYCCYFDIFVVV